MLAVLNSLWQAAVVAARVWAALKFAKRINAATRYAIWWAVLGVVLALPAAPRALAWWHMRAQAPQAAAVNRPAPARVTVPLIEDQPAMVTLNTERSARWPLWIGGLWAALCAYRLWQIGRSYVYLRGVKRRASVAQNAGVGRLPEAASKRETRLLLSRDVGSPMAVGFLHPAVILPEDLPAELAQPEMEHVLLHEAAHIARRDDWSNLLAKLLGAALALHPVAWWILRQIEREREIACDDWVVAKVGSARPYAESLARMSELRWARQAKTGSTHGKTQGEALASGIFGGGSRLGERIELLLERGREFSAGVSKVRWVVSTIALFGCVMAASISPKLVAFAQSRPAFEVASVKPSDPANRAWRAAVSPGGRYAATNMRVLDLIQRAYRVQPFQISGGPAWIGADRFDVTAKAADGISDDALGLMLQTLLADRFKLKVHTALKEQSVYRLVAGKSGVKVRQMTDVNGTEPAASVYSMRVIARKASMGWLSDFLAGELSAPVLDGTEMNGSYAWELNWDPSDPEGPSLFTAVQEQLGLRLEAAKAPVEVLVIDHVEKPDAN